MRAKVSCAATRGRGTPYQGSAKDQQWWLPTAVSGSLALHLFLAAASAYAFGIAWREPETFRPAVVYLLAAPAERTPSSLPANIVPPPDDLPVPVFEQAELRLPPPAEPPPPPDFRQPRAERAVSAVHFAPRVSSAPPPDSSARSTLQESLPSRATPAAPPASVASVAPGDKGDAFIPPAWDGRMSAWLEAHRIYPALARTRREQGDVMIRFTVAGDGRIQDVAVVAGSGHPLLDAAALAMLRGAVVPAPGSEARRTVRVRYHLAD